MVEHAETQIPTTPLYVCVSIVLGVYYYSYIYTGDIDKPVVFHAA